LKPVRLHKVFRPGFWVDLPLFQAQGFDVERKDCDYRSTSSGAHCAMTRMRTRPLEIVIDPVETGFPGAGMSREMQS
jgi:hypothetical protein